MADYYVDNDVYTGTLTGTLTFTNGSSTVTGSGTSFTAELSVGDYIKSDDATEGKEWYKVTAINSDTELTIDHNFQQGTHSATAKYNSNDGSESSPWSSPRKLFEELSAGDVGHLKKGQTYYISATIEPVNDGTIDNWVKVIGDWGTGDKPIFQDEGCYHDEVIYFYDDDFWHLENTKINGRLYARNGVGLKLKDVEIYDNNIYGALDISFHKGVYLENSIFKGYNEGFYLWDSSGWAKKCKFGSYITGNRAITIFRYAQFEFIDCEHLSDSNASYDLYSATLSSCCYLRFNRFDNAKEKQLENES